jgi:hypothetical protein
LVVEKFLHLIGYDGKSWKKIGSFIYPKK